MSAAEQRTPINEDEPAPYVVVLARLLVDAVLREAGGRRAENDNSSTLVVGEEK